MQPGDIPADEILKAVRASALLVKHRVANVLEGQGYAVAVNRQMGGRERPVHVDVWASGRRVRDEARKLTVSVRVLCFCLDNAHPLVFVERRKGRLDESLVLGNYKLPYKEYELKGGPSRTVESFRHLGLAAHHYATARDTFATDVAEMARTTEGLQTSDRSLQAEVIGPVLHLVEGLVADAWNEAQRFELRDAALFFPLVVFTGEAY